VLVGLSEGREIGGLVEVTLWHILVI